MKYPQLVSTRAVSAISDWLVTQLEQLGVDASSVYSRLLLSLLHTPLQINALDLAEISDNKVGNFARNKLLISKSGNGVNCRRFSAADTEALKRLAAIDSLLEAVPSDQQLSKIETLVDELSLKLREIEEQNGLDDSVFEIEQTDDALTNSKVTTIEKKSEASEDPANRYFNAFPALSEQSKTAFSLKPSWPQVNNQKDSISQKLENPSSSSGGAIAIVKKKSKRRRVTNPTMAPTLTNHMEANSGHATTQSKGAAVASTRNSRSLTGRNGQKKKSLEMWDTNFDGAWEMGRDLIREFVMKQNNRNRSISESEAARFPSLESESFVEKNAETDPVDLVDFASNSVKRCDFIDNDEENLMRVAAAATSALFGKNFEMNIYALSVPDTDTGSASSRFTDSSLFMSTNDKTVVRSEGYATPDTLASWSEIDASDQRRDREFMNCREHVKSCEDRGDCVDSGCDENVAAFEAKFNHNVEALWNDCKPNDTRVDAKKEAQLNHSFWFTYYNANADQSNQQPTNPSDQFKQLYANKQLASYSSGGDKNPFISAQPNSLNLNSASSSTTGGMNLTASIWSDNPNNNENDISFYANARLWEMNETNNPKSLNRKLNFYAMEPTANLHDKANVMMGAAANFDIGNADNSSFSKWSDTETAFAPIQQDACMSPQKINEEKIRKNLFENSYFCNYQSSSSSPMSNSTSAPNPVQIESMNSEFAGIQVPKAVKRSVTLVNHSPRSCFREVEPMSFEAKQELFHKNNARKYQSVPMDVAESEDLLTSERSRFRPIKQTYADGFAFDISNKLDQICYERSKSGLLYHDSEVYREYYVYDEEGNGGSHCDTEANTPAEFTLKYCIRQNDKSCQTDDLLSSQSNGSLSLNDNSNCMQSFSSLSSANVSSSQTNRLYFQRNDLNRVQYEKRATNDIIDKLIEISQDSWCSEDNRRCCNNNNNIHALWEHCATCSNDMISVPANSLLKDELSADGDEIMSDLKYLIQSISFRSDWEDSDSIPEYNDENNVLTQALKPKIADASRNLLMEYDEGFDDGTNDDFSSNHIYSNVNKLISDLLQPEKAQTLVQAISEKCQNGRLLADENCSTTQDSIAKKRIIHETKDIQATKNEISCNSSPLLSVNANNSNFFGSLWAYNNDNSIWRKELPTETEEKLPHETRSVNRLGEQWEHANLEKIWNSSSSEHSTQDVSMATEQQQQIDTDKMIFSTSSNSKWPSTDGTDTLAPDTHAKLETNTLKKFMDLIRQQSNEKEQCANAGSNGRIRNQNEHLHKHITRYDRKRRHSATSQNCFDLLNYALTNCDAIESIKKLATKTVGDYDGTNSFDCVPNEKTATTIITCKYWTACDSFCLTSTLAFNNNNNNTNNNNNILGDTEHLFNCYHKQMQLQSKYHPDNCMAPIDGNESLMHPTTFLAKQMATMVSRPLTR